jgi:hypothetical protein
VDNWKLVTRDALSRYSREPGLLLHRRSNGFAIYYFPGMLAILLFLAATRDRAMWQWLTSAGGSVPR